MDNDIYRSIYYRYKYCVLLLKRGQMIMTTAKIFENGRSQAVRLPKEYRFSEDEVFVNKIGEIVMLIPKSLKWNGLLNGMNMFSDDFMANGREEQPEQEREEL